jgi:LacI family transcriptional regulator
VLAYCLEHGHEATLLTTDNLSDVRRGAYDGVVGGLPRDQSHPIFKYVLESGVPVVEYSVSHPGMTAWCRCPLDGVLSGRLAADYLLRRPVAAYAFVSRMWGASEQVREKHFHAFLATGLNDRAYSRFAYDAEPDVGVDSDSRLAGFLRGLPRPAGVFASTDESARRVCDIALREGLKIPGDLYVLGNGNRELITRLAPVPITSIDIDYVAWGRAATAMLDEFTSGAISAGTVRLFAPRGVIERASTGGEAGGDPLATRALALMREHLADPLNLPEIAVRLGTSPATLKRAFAASFGTGVSERYLILRIEAAKSLLAAGDKVESAARAAGFASTGSFRKAFVKVTGVTPGGFAL